jgi:hypothetical protein
MDPIKCGCALAREADSDPDKTARQVLREIALDSQKMWCCPSAGFPEPDHRSEPIDPRCDDALGSVHRLTGIRCGTCPYWHVSRPEVIEAARLKRWRDKGQLQMRVRALSARMVDAIDAIDEGRADRDDHDIRMMRAEHEERERERMKDSKNGR